MEHKNDYIDVFEQYVGYTYPTTETRKINYVTYKYVPFNVEKIEHEDGSVLYSWKYLCLKLVDYNYKGLVKEFIFREYEDNSDIIAILLNYMADPSNDKYKKEFDDLQECRKKAKKFAKKHFEMN